MTATVARDTRTRPPMPPPKGVSRADNLPVAWVVKWDPDRGYGYFTLGADLYRVELVNGGEHCSTWHVSKVIADTEEVATPYTVTVPTPGGTFTGSCDCPAWRWNRTNPAGCKHLASLAYALELLEVHEITDDAVDRLELSERVAKCGAEDRRPS